MAAPTVGESAGTHSGVGGDTELWAPPSPQEAPNTGRAWRGSPPEAGPLYPSPRPPLPQPEALSGPGSSPVQHPVRGLPSPSPGCSCSRTQATSPSPQQENNFWVTSHCRPTNSFLGLGLGTVSHRQAPRPRNHPSHWVRRSHDAPMLPTAHRPTPRNLPPPRPRPTNSSQQSPAKTSGLPTRWPWAQLSSPASWHTPPPRCRASTHATVLPGHWGWHPALPLALTGPPTSCPANPTGQTHPPHQ